VADFVVPDYLVQEIMSILNAPYTPDERPRVSERVCEELHKVLTDARASTAERRVALLRATADLYRWAMDPEGDGADAHDVILGQRIAAAYGHLVLLDAIPRMSHLVNHNA